MKILTKNKTAYFQYEILEEKEAGISLLGHEVKAIKTNRISISIKEEVRIDMVSRCREKRLSDFAKKQSIKIYRKCKKQNSLKAKSEFF